MLKKIFLLLLFLNIIFTFFSITNSTNDSDINNTDTTDDFSWIESYINLDPSDDIYHDVRLKGYKPLKEYVENLQYNQKIDFFIDSVDCFNLRKNINILPRFPYVFLLYGGYSYNRGFDLGFLVRADNLANTQLAFTAATSFGQTGRFWFHTNIEYPALLNNRMKVFGTLSFFTSAPQYSSGICMYQAIYDRSESDQSSTFGNKIMTDLINKVWYKLGINFNKFRDTGFYLIGGLAYRIPLIELNIIGAIELSYLYNHVKDGTRVTGYLEVFREMPQEILIDRHNLGVNLKAELRWDRQKQTATLPVGNYLSLSTKFYLPTTIGYPNNEFCFKSRLEERFTYKILREFAFKFRLLIAANYNISEDFSGDPYVRGPARCELTGWFALLSNFEIYIPLIDFGLITGPAKPKENWKRPAKFVVYFMLFADGGFTIENYNYFLENYNERSQRNHIKNSLDAKDPYAQKSLGYGNYLLPAFSAGGGLHFYPYFLHFVLRADVGINIVKTIVYQNALEGISINISFNQMF